MNKRIWNPYSIQYHWASILIQNYARNQMLSLETTRHYPSEGRWLTTQDLYDLEATINAGSEL